MTAAVKTPGAVVDAAARVPSYPVVRLTIESVPPMVQSRPGQGGHIDDELVEGFVDSQVVIAGTRVEVRARLVVEAARVAAGRPCGAVRAFLSGFEAGPEPSPCVVVVTANGMLVPVAKAPQRAQGARVGRRQLLALMVVAGLSAGAVGELSWTLTNRAISTASVMPSAPTLLPKVVQLPVVPPVGYARVALWSVPLPAGASLADAKAPGTGGVVTGGGLVWAPSADGEGVVAVEVATGRTRWARSAGGNVVGGPVVAVVGGQRRLVTWTSSEVVVLDARTGDIVGKWPLPIANVRLAAVGAEGGPGTGVSAGAASGVVAVDQGQHVQVLTSRGWMSRVLPAGAAVAGVLSSPSEGTVVTAGVGRVWVVSSPSVAGEGTALTAPRGMEWTGAVGVVNDLLVVAYAPIVTGVGADGVAVSGGSGDGVALRGFRRTTASSSSGRGTEASWLPVWTSLVLPPSYSGSMGSTQPTGGLAVAPSGDWGIYGSTVIDLRSGRIHALPADWETSSLGESAAFGTTDGSVVGVDRFGRRGRAAEDPPSVSRWGQEVSVGRPVPPVAVATSSSLDSTAPLSGALALVVARDGSSTSLYAVPPLVAGGGR